MTFRLTEKALEDYEGLPRPVQALVDKQLGFLLTNVRHPSLHAKKYDESRDIWQIRISRDYRAYLKIDADCYVILTIIRHPK